MDVLRTLPDDSVDLCFTSPPFFLLRSYLPADHPDKGREIGAEDTPGEYIDALLDVTEELARVIAPHGSLCMEIGDSAAGSGGPGGDYAAGGMREGQPKADGTGRRQRAADEASGILPRTKRPGPNGRDSIPNFPLDKSVCLTPEIYRFALVYGFNPLTGRRTDQWRVRNVVTWARRNPSVGALGDKFRRSTSDIVMACKSRTRYFDLDAVRTINDRTNEAAYKSERRLGREVPNGGKETGVVGELIPSNPAGAPPLDCWWFDDEWDDTFVQDTWDISTTPYRGSHYAVFPSDLVVVPVKAMCPERVCTACGEPSRRIVELAPGRGGDHPGNNGGSTTAMGRQHLDAREAVTVGGQIAGTGHSDAGWFWTASRGRARRSR
jgi:site-specific DNA-methyltransferase (cytosine-N4-specific)